MGSINNPQGHGEVMRTAQSICLLGMQQRLLACLRESDYRGALLLCRRALASEEEQRTSDLPDLPRVPRRAQEQFRERLLTLLDQINALRLEVRTHTGTSR